MSKHTPGPWVTDNSVLRGSINRLDEPRRHIALTSDWENEKGDREQNEANARLIAAAPELLEALESAIECGMVPSSTAKDGGATRHARQVVVADMIRDAVAKAKGLNPDQG